MQEMGGPRQSIPAAAHACDCNWDGPQPGVAQQSKHAQGGTRLRTTLLGSSSQCPRHKKTEEGLIDTMLLSASPHIACRSHQPMPSMRASNPGSLVVSGASATCKPGTRRQDTGSPAELVRPTTDPGHEHKYRGNIPLIVHLAPCAAPGGGRPPTGSPSRPPRRPAQRRSPGPRLRALPPRWLEQTRRCRLHPMAPAESDINITTAWSGLWQRLYTPQSPESSRRSCCEPGR